MRFLQLEWHSHERARNAWDIERAEMKAKIAKQEGEVRSAKKLNDQLNKHIRMLEQVLMHERVKNKGGDNSGEDKKTGKAKGKGKADEKGGLEHKKRARIPSLCLPVNESKTNLSSAAPNKHHNSFLDVDVDFSERSEADREGLREKSKLYLTKCVEEITYLLTPPAQPPPQQPSAHSLANGSGFLNHGDAPLDELYLQHRQRQPQLPTAPNVSMSNHQAQNVPAISENHNDPYSAPQMQREPSAHHLGNMMHSAAPEYGFAQQTLGAQPQQGQTQQNFASVPEEQVEKVTHTYDNHGRQMPNRDEGNLTAAHVTSEEPENWTFEEPLAEIPQDLPPLRRPDTDVFPNADSVHPKSPPRGLQKRRGSQEKNHPSHGRRRSEEHETRELTLGQNQRTDPQNFKVRFALRGHLDVVRTVIFTGGGSPSEPEICTAGDDGLIKRWIIPASYANQHAMNNDLDISPYWSHRGHEGAVTSLAACPSTASFATGGRVSGDGWIFSGGQDSTVRVWERGRVDPKATLVGHTDAVWTVCMLPTTSGNVLGAESGNYGGADRILLASGSADGTIKIWAVSAPPQLVSPQTGSRRGVGGSRRHSVTSGSNYPSSPQPSVATSTVFHYMLVRTIERATHSSPTCISPLSLSGENFVVSFNDASILVYDTRTGEEIIGMASGETYDGTPATGIASVVATATGVEGTMLQDSGRGASDEEGVVHAATGSSSAGGVEGTVISGHEDQVIRFYDANSGMYNSVHVPFCFTKHTDISNRSMHV
jgi:striatin 1/3/4